MSLSIETILVGLALLALVVAFVAWPFYERPARQRARRGAGQSERAGELEARRARIVTAIRELDFDHGLGKVADEDYEALRAQLVSEGADVLRAADALAGRRKPAAARRAPASPSTPAPAPAPAAEDDLEREIAARRKHGADAAARPAVAGGCYCPKCGREAQPDETFCPRCGTRLPRDTEKVTA